MTEKTIEDVQALDGHVFAMLSPGSLTSTGSTETAVGSSELSSR
ncbi:MAG: hypothetical protein ACYC9J_11710 [Sulfuricaulis sp.]